MLCYVILLYNVFISIHYIYIYISMCMLTLFAAVVSALWGMSSAGGPWCACRVCGGGVIVVSPGSWVLGSDRRDPSIHVPHPNRKPGAEHRNEWRRREREREKPHEHTGNVRRTWVRLWSAMWISGLPVLALLCSQQALSSDKTRQIDSSVLVFTSFLAWQALAPNTTRLTA